MYVVIRTVINVEWNEREIVNWIHFFLFLNMFSFSKLQFTIIISVFFMRDTSTTLIEHSHSTWSGIHCILVVG